MKNKLKSKRHIYIILSGIVFSFVFLLFTVRAASPDAIGVRIMPNPDHLSSLSWYKNNIRVQGSPQALDIDGYGAIRDGRTVYVNAANAVNNNFYTNIYIISYNQEAENQTTDIFGQILEHWKFNSNVSDPDQKAKIIRDTKRLADLAETKLAMENYKNKNGKYPDLSSGSYLANKTLSVWPSWQGTLAKELGVSLPVDPVNKLGACPDGYDPATCWDEKNKKFFGDIPSSLPVGSQAYIYNAAGDGLSYGLCANMESGYLNMEAQGACTANTGNAASGVIIKNAPVFTGSNLPKAYSGSSYQGFIQADRAGLNWSLAKVSGCDLWSNLRVETSKVATQKKISAVKAGQAGDCVIALTIKDGAAGKVQNFTIKTENKNFPVVQPVSNKEVTVGNDLSFTIQASEADNQYPLAFQIVSGSLPAGLIGGVVNQHDYQISGTVVDSVGDYNISLIAVDSYLGQSAPINFTIKVKNNPPVISPVANKEVIIGSSINFTVQASDPDGAIHYPLIFNIIGSLPSGLAYTTAANGRDAEIGGLLIDDTKDYDLAITATDIYGAVSAPVNFKITVKNNAPVFTSSALPSAIGCKNYSYQFQAGDPDGHSVNNFIAANLPSGLSLSAGGLLSGAPAVPAGSYTFNVAARDEFYDYTASPYSAEASRAFTLSVADESFSLNLTTDSAISNNTIYVYVAGVNGLLYGPVQYNGVASATTDNPVTYSLSGNPAWLAVNPRTGSIQGTPTSNTNDPGDKNITVTAVTNNFCRRTASKNLTIHVLANQWCGDGSCNPAENTSVCAMDCPYIPPCTPSCSGKTCGPDGCGGTCGTCSSGNICSAGSCCPTQAGIQVCADNCHETYFNGSPVSSACDWASVQEFNVTAQPGKNVIAVKSWDWGSLYGFSATLNRGSCASMTTDDITNWKCVNYEVGGWTDVNLDDSSWPSAVSGYPGSAGIRAGNYLPYRQIWAQGAGERATVYCRYTFMVY